MWKTLTTAEKLAAIRTAWSANTPVSHIAARIPGATKNAIIGIYGRNPDLRIDYPLRDQKAALAIENARRSKRDPKLRIRRKPMDAPKLLFRLAEPHTAPLDLMGLSRGRCKWPVSEGSPFLFCCHEARGSYCEFHAGLAIGVGTETERSAHRALRREMVS